MYEHCCLAICFSTSRETNVRLEGEFWNKMRISIQSYVLVFKVQRTLPLSPLLPPLQAPLLLPPLPPLATGAILCASLSVSLCDSWKVGRSLSGSLWQKGNVFMLQCPTSCHPFTLCWIWRLPPKFWMAFSCYWKILISRAYSCFAL